MLLSFVSDVHGNFDALAEVAEHAEQLIVLGDLLDYVDYHDPAGGILGAIFGADRVREFTTLRAAGDFAALHRYNAALWHTVDDAAGVLADLVATRYRAVADIIGRDAIVILGNVDVADEWRRAVGEIIPARDAETATIDGVRLGFVAGGARRGGAPTVVATAAAPVRPWRPFVRTADEYRAAVGRLGEVDVLCSHIPPDLPLLRYDRMPGRLEAAGPGLLEYIDRVQPVYSVFGHVHQPIARRARRGWTECVNVGHFQRSMTAWTLDTDRVRAARDERARVRHETGR